MRAEIITINREPARAAAAAPSLAAGLTGVILAGGQSDYFAGMDKGLLPVRGRALVKRVLEQLVMQVRQIVIVTNRNQSLYASYGYPVVSDALPDHQGTLSGIAAGLAAIETTHALFVPVDAARLPSDLAQSLWQVHAQRQVPCVVHGAGHPIAACCLVPKSERQSAEAALASGQRDALEWLRGRGAVEVDYGDWPAQFWNLHSPDELPALETALRR